jgi:hypothetical protein
LLSCSSVIDCWPITSSVHQDHTQIPHSHNKPIISICCNNESLIVTICKETLKVWESSSAEFIYSIKERKRIYRLILNTSLINTKFDKKLAHGRAIDLTCVTCNENRLATGAADGI